MRKVTFFISHFGERKNFRTQRWSKSCFQNNGGPLLFYINSLVFHIIFHSKKWFCIWIHWQGHHIRAMEWKLKKMENHKKRAMKIKKHENVLAGLANPHMSTKSHDQKSAKFRKCKNQGWQNMAKNVLVNFPKKMGAQISFFWNHSKSLPWQAKTVFLQFQEKPPQLWKSRGLQKHDFFQNLAQKQRFSRSARCPSPKP